jgi:hypothetical protein
MQTKQYSPDGKRWWDGTRSLTVSSRRWIVILFFSLFSAVVSLFTIAPTSAGMGSAALFFGSWLVFAVTGGYALAFRRHVFPFAAMSLVLVSMSGWLAGLATSPSSGELPRPLLSTGATAPVVVPSSNVTLTASTSASTVCASSTEHRAVDVDLSSPGPWQAHLVGFNDCEIQSVTYWIRDAKHHWRSSETIRSQPFTAPVQWWQGDNSGYEVVTAHVKLHSGKMLTNPGGWHWVDGHHSSPEGTISVKLNADATAQASYAPALHGSVIQRVDFWLRSAHDRWTRTGPAMRQADGTYSVSRLAGTETADWNGPDAAVAVHVVWPNGADSSQLHRLPPRRHLRLHGRLLHHPRQLLHHPRQLLQRRRPLLQTVHTQTRPPLAPLQSVPTGRGATPSTAAEPARITAAFTGGLETSVLPVRATIDGRLLGPTPGAI